MSKYVHQRVSFYAKRTLKRFGECSTRAEVATVLADEMDRIENAAEREMTVRRIVSALAEAAGVLD